MLKKTVTAISVAALTGYVAALPTTVSAAQGVAPVQLGSCNPCAARKKSE
jgi:hypothetical protein